MPELVLPHIEGGGPTRNTTTRRAQHLRPSRTTRMVLDCATLLRASMPLTGDLGGPTFRPPRRAASGPGHGPNNSRRSPRMGNAAASSVAYTPSS